MKSNKLNSNTRIDPRLQKLTDTYAAVTTKYVALIAEYGQMWGLALALYLSGDYTMTQIAEYTGIDRGKLSRKLTELQKKGGRS